MGLSKASGAINRTLLWTALYKKGIPEGMIKHIRRVHRGERLEPKYRGRYGDAKDNNIGVFRRSEISAILFIIYLGGAMEDLAALDRGSKQPIRIIQDRPRGKNKKLLWGK